MESLKNQLPATRYLFKSMIKFLKAQASSILATIFDFSTTIVLVQLFSFEPVLGNALGNVAGGVTNFTINRYWVFDSRDNSVQGQALKYILVWIGNMALNAAGMYLMTLYFGKEQIVFSKVFVSLLVGFGYNYLLQKRFVFK